jgi:hypothetical protein
MTDNEPRSGVLEECDDSTLAEDPTRRETPSRRWGSHLSTLDLHRLDVACRPIREAFGGFCLYLVGSATARDTYRDVDVRLILDDDQFDHLIVNRTVWEMLSLGISAYLTLHTGLPIDFQVQRQTEANKQHVGFRNPIGTGRVFAGGGDATPRWAEET